MIIAKSVKWQRSVSNNLRFEAFAAGIHFLTRAAKILIRLRLNWSRIWLCMFWLFQAAWIWSVRVAERLALPTSDHRVAGSNPAGSDILPEPKRRFIAQSLSCSPFHRLEMTEILLKGRKTLTHPSKFHEWDIRSLIFCLLFQVNT